MMMYAVMFVMVVFAHVSSVISLSSGTFGSLTVIFGTLFLSTQVPRNYGKGPLPVSINRKDLRSSTNKYGSATW
jgi:hypothetical protein